MSMQIKLPRAFIILISLVALVWLLQWAWNVLSVLYDIVLLFFLAWLLGFIMQPLIERIRAALHATLGLPRGLAVGLVYLAIFLTVFGGLLVLIPLAVGQTVQLARQAPLWAATLPSQLQGVEDTLIGWGLDVDLDTAIRRLDLVATAQTWGAQATLQAVQVITGIANILARAFLVIIISFYMYLDAPRIRRRVERLVPTQWSGEVDFFTESVNRTFGGFVRSQLLYALLTFIGTVVIMSVAELPFILAVSLLAGGIMVVPYLGSWTAFLVPTMIALQKSTLTAIGVGAAIVVMQQILVRLVMPRIMSYTTGMPPILVLAGMLTGVRLAGIWGALFGAPIVGILYTMFLYIYERLMPRLLRPDDYEPIDELPRF
jgi:predicted PurR-regulated permease PerM